VSFHFTKLVDHSLYPRTALTEARQAYRNYCSFKVTPLGSDRAEITVIVSDEYQNDSRQIVLEFFNYALDRAAQIQFDNDPD
jgi:hypothetical protein